MMVFFGSSANGKNFRDIIVLVFMWMVSVLYLLSFLSRTMVQLAAVQLLYKYTREYCWIF